MGVMWLLVAAGVVVIVAVVAVVVVRRPEGGDLSSVDRYHSALGTMEQVTERTGSAPVRMVGPIRGRRSPRRRRGRVGGGCPAGGRSAPRPGARSSVPTSPGAGCGGPP